MGKECIRTWSIGYQKSKQRAKRLYSKIGRISCPAFSGNFVSFNCIGFNHLIRKGRIPRTRNEQKRRFVLLSYVEKIIKDPEANIVYKRKETKYKTNRYGNKCLTTSMADFWTFIKKIDSCTIKVVIAQTNKKGGKYFLSIMGDNVKIKNKRTKKPLK